MGKVRVAAFAVSLDGFGAGPRQSLENPLGVGGPELHQWFYPTKTFQTMFGKAEGETGVDDGFAARSMQGVGAWILGRNMFGPVRGPWPDDSWKGWWGPSPPYHVPTYVLTHHPRVSLTMEGGTVFHFVKDGLDAALARAREAAGERDVRIGGGVATLREAFAKRFIDEAHLVQAPTLLGAGENLFDGLDLKALGYAVAERVAGERATHLVLRKAA
jgi:dihydrofolate reductase